MSEHEVSKVLKALESALNVFRQNEGRLTVAQIRARSMLSMIRSELAPADKEPVQTSEPLFGVPSPLQSA